MGSSTTFIFDVVALVILLVGLLLAILGERKYRKEREKRGGFIR